jgi:NAD(P)-dependent dehydrogenase (short-subunit alcohol dehydrogenase family)
MAFLVVIACHAPWGSPRPGPGSSPAAPAASAAPFASGVKDAFDANVYGAYRLIRAFLPHAGTEIRAYPEHFVDDAGDGSSE